MAEKKKKKNTAHVIINENKAVEVKIVRKTSPTRNLYISEEDKDMDRRVGAAVKAAINKAKVKNAPVADYDPVEKKSYLEFADGRKESVRP